MFYLLTFAYQPLSANFFSVCVYFFIVTCSTLFYHSCKWSTVYSVAVKAHGDSISKQMGGDSTREMLVYSCCCCIYIIVTATATGDNRTHRNWGVTVQADLGGSC